MSHWWRTTPRARRPHVCDQCTATIDPGNVYVRLDGVDGGQWATTRSCVPCADLAKSLYKAGWEDTDADGGPTFPWLLDVDYWDDVIAHVPALTDQVIAYETRRWAR